MRQLKYILLLIGFILLQLGYGQCPFTNLADDLDNSSDEFKTILNTNEGFNAYRVLSLANEEKAIRVSKAALENISDNLATNPNTVDQLADEIKNAGGYSLWKINNIEENFEDFLTVNGKVKKAGDKSILFNSFSNDDNSNIPLKYLINENRFNDLAKDPDQGYNIKASTRKEAMTGLEAESQNILSNIERGPKGIEFYDKNRIPWDVKTPPGEYFNVNSIGSAIKKELTTSKTIDGVVHPPGKFIDPNSGDIKFKQILLDCTYINENQLSDLRNWLNQSGLSQEQLNRIVEVNVNL
ncbi:hypothetical protein GCM10009430_12480 [Aquimarina litoralis]|uniref:Uncharacterized protein n=1 Tax=Aquimarina litoralis TaxID=584605 RepID=A0ABN1ILB4_9FLAO